MEIMKIAALALLGTITAMLLKQGKAEYSTIVGLAMAMLVCGYVVQNLMQVVNTVQSIWVRVTGNSQFLEILLRMIGITYLTDLTAGICKECGYQVLSGQVTLAGKVGVLLTGFPIFVELMNFVLSLGGNS